MVAAGNHEKKDNFNSYVYRFYGLVRAGQSSGSNNNFFYSFDYGLIHYVIIDTEVRHWVV